MSMTQNHSVRNLRPNAPRSILRWFGVLYFIGAIAASSLLAITIYNHITIASRLPVIDGIVMDSYCFLSVHKAMDDLCSARTGNEESTSYESDEQVASIEFSALITASWLSIATIAALIAFSIYGYVALMLRSTVLDESFSNKSVVVTILPILPYAGWELFGGSLICPTTETYICLPTISFLQFYILYGVVMLVFVLTAVTKKFARSSLG